MNFLPDELFQEQIIQSLDYDDQMQLLDCSVYLHKQFKKDYRRIVLHEGKVLRCVEEREYLRKIVSKIKDPGKQLVLKGIMDWGNQPFPFPKVFSLKFKNPAVFSQFWADQTNQLTIQVATLESRPINLPDLPMLQPKITQYDIPKLVQLCSEGVIKELSFECNTSTVQIPYLPKLKLLILHHAKFGVQLPVLYTTHLQKLGIWACSEIDVSCLGNIPDLQIGYCEGVHGLPHLTNNRKIRIEETSWIGDKSTSFVNSEKIVLKSTALSLDLTKCQRVRVLKIESQRYDISYRTISIIDGNLPPTVRRCRLWKDSINKYNWRSSAHQLVELSLNCDESIKTFSGFGLDNILLIHLFSMEALESLAGLGGRNKIVTVKSCNKLEDFSSLRSVDTVLIEGCQGFQDLEEVSRVRNLTLRRHKGKLKNLKSLGKATEVLAISLVSNFSHFSDIAKIPDLTMYLPGLDDLETFLKNGGKFYSQVITIYSAKFPKVFYESYLSPDYDYPVVKYRGPVVLIRRKYSYETK